MVKDTQTTEAEGRLIYCGDHAVTFSFGGHAFLAKLLGHFDPATTIIVEAGAETSQPHERLPGYEYRQLCFPLDRLARTRWSKWHAQWVVTNKKRRGRRIARFLKLTPNDCLMTIAHDFVWIPVIEAARQVGAKVLVFCDDEWVELFGHKFPSLEIAKNVYADSLQKADSIQAVSEGMRQHLKLNYGVESEVFYRVRRNELSANPPSTPKPHKNFRFIYCGQLWDGYWNSLREVAAAGMKHGWEIEIFTNAHGQRVAGREFPNVVARDFLPEEELVPYLQENADALVVALDFSPAGRKLMETMFASKLVEYTMTGLPTVILAPPYAEMTRWGREAGCFCVLDRLDGDTVEKELVGFVADEVARRRMGREAFELGKVLFSPEQAKKQILRAISGHTH